LEKSIPALDTHGNNFFLFFILILYLRISEIEEGLSPA